MMTLLNQKILNKISIFLALFTILAVFSCHKDNENDIIAINTSGVNYKWSTNENLFFNKNNSKERDKSGSRDDQFKVILREPILELYRHIADQNQRYSYIDNIVESVGVPLWNNAYIYFDEVENKELILLPFKNLEN